MKLTPMLASISCRPTGQCSFRVGDNEGGQLGKIKCFFV